MLVRKVESVYRIQNFRINLSIFQLLMLNARLSINNRRKCKAATLTSPITPSLISKNETATKVKI